MRSSHGRLRDRAEACELRPDLHHPGGRGRRAGALLARPAKPASTLEQSAALPPAEKLDFLRWGGRCGRTRAGWRARSASSSWTEQAASSSRTPRALAARPSGPAWSAGPRSRKRRDLRFAWDARGTDLGAFADGFFAQLAGGPPGEGWFSRGDVERDGKLSISDAIDILLWLFSLQPGLEVCQDAADANDDGAVDLADAIRILTHLFAGGAPLAPPGLERPGADPTSDGLGCK